MGNEFPSNYIKFDQTHPNVAASSNGRFIVVWVQSEGNIFGHIFMNDGTKLGNQFQINTDIGSYYILSITALKNNNFVVAWSDCGNIYAQIFTENEDKVGIQLKFASGYYSSITSLFNGHFVVSYRCYPNICAQVFYCDGTIQGPPFQADTYIGYDCATSISSISTSNFMIVWGSQGQDNIGINY